MLCVGDDRGDGLVVVSLFCRGDSFVEGLRCGARLGVFVNLVEPGDDVNGVGVTLLKIVQALRGAFFS